MSVRYEPKEHIQALEVAPRTEGMLDQREITIQSFETTVPFDFPALDAGLDGAWLTPAIRFGVFSKSRDPSKDGFTVVLGLQDQLSVRAYDYDKRRPLWYSWKDIIVDTVCLRYYRGENGLLSFITTGGGRRISDEKLEAFNSSFLGIPGTAVTKQQFDLTRLRTLCFNRFVDRLYMVRFTDPSSKEYRSIDHALFQSRDYIDPKTPRLEEVKADEQVKIESFDSNIDVRSRELASPIRVRFFIRGLSGALRLRFPKLEFKGGTRSPERQAEVFYGIVNATRESILDDNYYLNNQESLADLSTDQDLFPEMVDLSRYRSVFKKSKDRAAFFADLDVTAPKIQWYPHLRAIDELLPTDVVRDHVGGLAGELTNEKPLMASKMLDACRADAKLQRVGAVVAGTIGAQLYALPAEVRTHVEETLLAWAVDCEHDGWDVDPDTGEIAMSKWRGRLDGMAVDAHPAVIGKLMGIAHARLMGAEGDIGPLLRRFNWCVNAASTLPANHSKCPASLRLVVDGRVSECVGDGSKVLKEPVGDLASLDEGVLNQFGLPLWPSLHAYRNDGKIVISNAGIGAARSMRVLRAGELPGVSDTPGVDLGPGKNMSLPADGDPTALEICFTKFGKDFRATLPVAAALPADGAMGEITHTDKPSTAMSTKAIEHATAKAAQETLAPVIEAFKKASLVATPPHQREWWQNVRVAYDRQPGPGATDKWRAVTKMVVTGAIEESKKPVKDRQSDYLTPLMLKRLIEKLNASGASRAAIEADYAEYLRRRVTIEEAKAAKA